MTARTSQRLAQGAAAVLTPEEAANLLPWRDADARRWLRSKGLVHSEVVDDRDAEYVLWGDVLDELRKKSLQDSARASGDRGRGDPLKRMAL